MRCRPNDTVIFIGGFDPALGPLGNMAADLMRGMVTTVTVHDGVMWRLEPPLHSDLRLSMVVVTSTITACVDEFLRPLRGLPDEAETIEECIRALATEDAP